MKTKFLDKNIFAHAARYGNPLDKQLTWEHKKGFTAKVTICLETNFWKISPLDNQTIGGMKIEYFLIVNRDILPRCAQNLSLRLLTELILNWWYRVVAGLRQAWYRVNLMVLIFNSLRRLRPHLGIFPILTLFFKIKKFKSKSSYYQRNVCLKNSKS